MNANELFQKIWFKIAVLSAIFGFFISLILVLISGLGFPALIIRPILSAIFLSMVCVLSFFLLKKYVPDILSLISSSEQASEDIQDKKFNQMDEDFNVELNMDKSAVPTDESAGQMDYEQSPAEQKTEATDQEQKKPSQIKKKKVAGSDEILVEGIPMKKDPDLMAKAIQHVLDSDKE